MANETDWPLLVKVGMSVAGATSTFFFFLARWIIGDQLKRNQTEHARIEEGYKSRCSAIETQVKERCGAIELKVNDVATRQDIRELHSRLDRWQEKRVTRDDIIYQNEILDDIKKRLGLPVRE